MAAKKKAKKAAAKKAATKKKVVAKAAAKAAKEGNAISDEERLKLVSTEQSLQMDTEPKIPSNMAGLESFTLADAPEEDSDKEAIVDADSLFNLPKGGGDDEE